MQCIVIKLPGAGLLETATVQSAIPWHGYRGYHIVHDFFRLLPPLLMNIPNSKVFFVCGSIGSFIYTDFAKTLGIDDELFLDALGVNITRMLISILKRFLHSCRIRICDEDVSVDCFDSQSMNAHDVFFVAPDVAYNSSDHLAVSMAHQVHASHLFFVKQGIPNFYVGFPEPTQKHAFYIDELKKISSTYTETPGKKYLLDKQSIELLPALDSKVFFIAPENIGKIPNVIAGKFDHRELTEVL